jgi:FMN phosphatase YigB (HAD superfamily)
MATSRTIKTLLVDCDGVLNNNAIRQKMQGEAVASFFGTGWKEVVDAFFRANQKMYDTYRPTMTAEEYKEKWLQNDVYRFKLMGEELGVAVSDSDGEKLSTLWRSAWTAYDEHPVRYDDALLFLEHMKALGIPMVLVSGVTNENRWELLSLLGIQEYFTRAFGTQSVGYQKKDVRFYESVLNEIGASPEETAIIGDHPIDDVGAGRLGIYTIHLLRPEDPRAPVYDVGEPNAVVHDLHEAADHIEQLVKE